MNRTTVWVAAMAVSLGGLVGCSGSTGLYQKDLSILKRYTDGFELTDSTGRGRLVVVPQYQGRVMTSTYAGLAGRSLGWINPTAIRAGVGDGPINPYGGEERFWLGPEGGQFTIFFKPGDPFDLAHWKVPALIDTEPFELVDRKPNRAVFRKTAQLTNRAGFTFHLRIDRSVEILEPARIRQLLGLDGADDLAMVGYETVNGLTNVGDQPWTEKTGMLSIWLLGMFPATPHTTAVLPIRSGGDQKLGPRVNVYESFNKLDHTRLRAEPNAVFFKADANYRSKIGISPQRALPVLGSYNADDNILTIVQYNQPQGVRRYVKSTWEIQDDPFSGDVVNSYNDGKPAPHRGQLGKFYELETSSPAAALAPGQQIRHVSHTYHLTGSRKSLDAVARKVLGVSLKQITGSLP